jgi:hypothetical protein
MEGPSMRRVSLSWLVPAVLALALVVAGGGGDDD